MARYLSIAIDKPKDHPQGNLCKSLRFEDLEMEHTERSTEDGWLGH